MLRRPVSVVCCGQLLLVFMFMLTAMPLSAADGPRFVPDDVGFKKLVAPFLEKHCTRCHGAKKQEGSLRVDQHLTTAFTDSSTQEKWGEVLNVLNSHEMPPEGEPQPEAKAVAAVSDWITQQRSRAELIRRDGHVVLRRLNREEYRNTIRDLIGVDFDISGFPQDPPAGGFDNNGQALTMSPLQTELYLEAARKILDRALFEGDRPATVRWRFQPESGDSDSNRVRYDGQNLIVNGGKNKVDGDFKVMHHDSWDRHLNAREFRVPREGEYVVRIRAAGNIPDRKAVIETARAALEHRRKEQDEKNPNGKKWTAEQLETDLAHFQQDRMYDYGPPRLKLIQTLGGQPKTLSEFDVPAPLNKPQEYEVRGWFTPAPCGLTIEYAYRIPRVLENFWFQSHDTFARPELYVDWFEIEGPMYAAWPPESHIRVLGKATVTEKNERTVAKDVLSKFMRRAYRRPVTPEEVESKLKLLDLVRKDAPSFVQAMKTPLTAVLVSPHFLYIAEPMKSVSQNDNRDSRKLTPHELAARLSYFLWSSMPDSELFQLAENGKIRDAVVLKKQVDRMLADPKAEAFVSNFAGQWLGLREVGANPPAEDLYPQYDRHLEVSMVEESKAFFREILRHDLSVMNFVRSDFVTINERLARYYGIPDVRGDHFRRVPVPTGVHRGGVMTQASVLTITSNGTRTSPVKRGTWVMKNVLGVDPGLPVANAGDIAPKVPGIDKATVRKRLEIHRELAQCARCHNKIDPLGFALENYNAAGEWRDREGFGYKGRVGRDDPLIDASSKLPDGTAINGVEGLQAALIKQDRLFLRCLSEKLTSYALGREISPLDEAFLQTTVTQMQKHPATLRSLIHAIVGSTAFGEK